MSAHARKEWHMFAHHREIVARIVEVEYALVVRIMVVIFKQVHANRCAVNVRLGVFGQRWNVFHGLVLRVHLGRGNCRVA